VALVVSTASAGKLLVRSYNGRDWDLYVMDEDGTNLRSIDASSTNIGHADFSPDDKTILFSAETTPGNVSIFQVPVDGGTPRVVPGGANVSVYRPCWGSSSDHFYYSGVVGGSCGNYDVEIHKLTYTLDADGLLDELISDETVLATKNVQLWDINESLNKMACRDVMPAACNSACSIVVTYNADGTGRRVLSATNDGRSESFTTLSPNGQYILYFRSDTGSGDPHNVYRIRWDGTGQQRLTSYAHAAYPIWRDDDTIFYGVTPNMYSTNYVPHRLTISTGEDVVIPTGLPNCVPVDFTMASGPLIVEIDIKPGSYPNAINLGAYGMIPVAILSTTAFDATTVDPATVQLAGADVDVRGKSDQFMAHEEGINGDGLIDLVLQVVTQNLDQGTFQDGYAILTGITYSGQSIEGADEITIVPSK
jgi:dipeptidyl aminopeptidase/acylaminoacyl peptidase